MENPDARLLNPNTQNYLRQQAIRLREQGKRIIDIAAYLGVHRNTITDWWKDYQTHGNAGLTQQQLGRRVGAVFGCSSGTRVCPKGSNACHKFEPEKTASDQLHCQC